MMFECMDAALNNGAQGIAVFTMLGLRSPEVKKQFKLIRTVSEPCVPPTVE